MNANELADALDNLGHNYTNQTEIAIKSAAMLRQQQAKIEAFEKFITDNTERTEDTKMNNEPVAWMTENRYLITKDENLANIIKEKGEEPIIPLYTHPAKTLTDEEIYEVWCDAIKEEAIVNKGKPPILKYQPFVFFARAILRKAHE
jgi:hypothetical protein